MVDPQNVNADMIHELNSLAGEYSFYLDDSGGAAPKIRVKVWLMDRELGGDRYAYTISHAVHTPTQIGPYYTSAPYAKSEQGALERAIRDTLSFYRGAITAGQKPAASWFVPNEDF